MTGFLAALGLFSALLAGGCGHREAPADETAQYGVADMETLVRAHPRYAEYFRLETEYQSLLARYRTEQKQLMRLASVKNAGNRAASGEEEYKTKLKIKEDALNQKLERKYQEIRARHAMDAGKPVLAGEAGDIETRIANLQLRLKVEGLSGGDRTQEEEDLKSLLNERYARQEQQGFTDEEKKELADMRLAAKKELGAYAEELAEEIRKEQAARRASSPLPDPDAWNGSWEERLKAKQNEMAAVKADIMKDIREEAAVIAKEKQLAMIFTSYRANIHAEDVTGDIVNELVQTERPETDTAK